MKEMKRNGKLKLRRICLGVVFTFLYIFPIFFLVFQSKIEMKEYESVDLKIEEKSYGEPCQVMRQDVKSNLIVNVEGVSAKTEIIGENTKNYLWNVNKGDEIKKGECIGWLGKKEVKTYYNGIVNEIRDNYVRIEVTV